MGYLHSEELILEAAVKVALADGMAGLTFKAVADRLGIRDRTVVYYFPNKTALITSVVVALSGHLQGMLDAAFGTEPKSGNELIRQAWPVLTTPEADRIFALFFEIVGLGVAGQEPYEALVRLQVQGWVDWLTPRSTGDDDQSRQQNALSVVARIDGLLMLRQILGGPVSESAFQASISSSD